MSLDKEEFPREMSDEALRIRDLEFEVASLQIHLDTIMRWYEEGEKLFEQAPSFFWLGVWWADRPWRKKN